MLFNSYSFIFIFLPLFLVAWQLVFRYRPDALLFCLLIASMIFYGLWSPLWLLLLLIMSLGNYLWGRAISGTDMPGNALAHFISRRAFLICAIAFNLLPLIWFKYSWFLLENAAILFHADWRFTPPALPLGLSFYVFIQIAWLVGIYRGEYGVGGLYEHAAYSICFPYIISGPIVRRQQIGWQLAELGPISARNLAFGLTLFIIGLAKKTIMADSLGLYADAVFNAANKGWAMTGMEAWGGSLCYTFQLYFDFSGYTDMALGLALIIGLRLPENFNSPYKATGIIEFWRRWHITLSSWLRDFLYIPLGGNRYGKARQYVNLFLTMLIGGLWHGAGWTYMIWGALQGGMLCANHFFRICVRYTPVQRYLDCHVCRFAFIGFTFLCLNLCWVVFRAPSLDAAAGIYKAMFTGNFLALPDSAGGGAQGIAGIFALEHRFFTGWQPLALLGVSFIICWACPTSRSIMEGSAGIFSWRPTQAWGICAAFLTFLALALLSRQTAFLYFQF